MVLRFILIPLIRRGADWWLVFSVRNAPDTQVFWLHGCCMDAAITGGYKAALRDHGFNATHGDDASMQPGKLQEIMLPGQQCHGFASDKHVRCQKACAGRIQGWTALAKRLSVHGFQQICTIFHKPLLSTSIISWAAINKL